MCPKGLCPSCVLHHPRSSRNLAAPLLLHGRFLRVDGGVRPSTASTKHYSLSSLHRFLSLASRERSPPLPLLFFLPPFSLPPGQHRCWLRMMQSPQVYGKPNRRWARWASWVTRADTLRTQILWTSCRRQNVRQDRTARGGGARPKPSSRLAEGTYKGQKATHAFRRATDSLRVIPEAYLVGIERRLMGIEELAAVSCPCCDAADVGPRHAHTCPRAGEQVDQYQLLLQAIFRTEVAWCSSSN